jgi:hypothetical protein
MFELSVVAPDEKLTATLQLLPPSMVHAFTASRWEMARSSDQA